MDVRTLLRAAETTGQNLEKRRRVLSEVKGDDDASVIFVGSWGRREVTRSSDNDFYVLVNGPERDSMDVRPSTDEVSTLLREAEGGFARPGREGTFGEIVFLDSLVGRIGLGLDSNENTTRRMLLVLESTSVWQEARHQEARERVIAAYLKDPIKDHRPPRLFLNDLVRYWRTMCVDFAGKMRERENEGFGLRNAKLRTTRKMLFAGGLLPILRCSSLRAEEMERFLNAQFAMSPLDRIADAFLHYRAHEAAAAVLESYDRWLALLDDDAFRNALDAVGPDGAEASREFSTAARLGADIETGLLDLLFSPALFRWTRNFAIF